MRKIISTIIYTLSAVLTFALLFLSIVLSEKTIGFYNIWFVGDINAFVALLVSGTLVFSLSSLFLLRFENNIKPTFLGHVRYCLFFYFVFVVLLLKRPVSLFSGGLASAYAVMAISVSLAAILVNGFVVFLKRRKY